jgi:Na+-driven multidrug efflux pump
VEIVLTPPSDESEKVNEPHNGPTDESAYPPMQVNNSVGFRNESLFYMWTIVRYDRETKRILRLAIPFTFSAIVDNTSELIILAIISHTLGTDAMVAYAMTDGLVGITSSFMGGWHEAVTSLVSMACGAQNYDLAGQYVQIACISYVLCEIPVGCIWVATMSKILLLMGFDDSVAMLGQDFVWVRILINIMTGVNQCLLDFLAAVEYAAFANVMYCVGCGGSAGGVALFAYQFDASLVVLGLVILVNCCLLFFVVILFLLKMEGVQKFEAGLFFSCAWTDMSVVKDVRRVALPLAFGSLLAYAEWEILTLFATVLGPAEVATWAVMGFVWDMFESTTEAIGDASEVRVAYQLGKGRPSMAKLASYKSMFIALMSSILVSIIFSSLKGVLPSWLTRDATIQNMLAEMFPLVALGNVTMTMGMVCWAVIGAQGRYYLSTLIAITCSFVVTIPIGAVMVSMRIDLQGLAFALFTGYTVTAMILSSCILMSDWENLSKKIREQVDTDDLSDSSDNDSSSSSSGCHSAEIRNSQHHEGCQKSQAKADYPEVPPISPGCFTEEEPPPPPPPLVNPLSTPERVRLPCLAHRSRNSALEQVLTPMTPSPLSQTPLPSIPKLVLTPRTNSTPGTPAREVQLAMTPEDEPPPPPPPMITAPSTPERVRLPYLAHRSRNSALDQVLTPLTPSPLSQTSLPSSVTQPCRTSRTGSTPPGKFKPTSFRPTAHNDGVFLPTLDQKQVQCLALDSPGSHGCKYSSLSRSPPHQVDEDVTPRLVKGRRKRVG